VFGTIGGPELVLILVIALIVFGPRKLPEIGKSVGKMMREFRQASNEFQRTIEDEIDAEKRTPRPLPPPANVVTPKAPTTESSPIEPEKTGS
jgi:sec-independent protein translocase protein TatA